MPYVAVAPPEALKGISNGGTTCPSGCLENPGRRDTILRAPGKSEFLSRAVVCNSSLEGATMKRILALMFALALTVSMSSFAFAQASGSDAKAGDKTADSKDKKPAKKKAAKKKDDAKKDDAMKKDNMSK
jgi:hypothetical protein